MSVGRHLGDRAPHMFIFFTLQVQIFPIDFEKLEEKDIEFFISRDRPILGIDAKPHPNPKVSKLC